MKFGVCFNAEKAIREFPTQADYIEISGMQIHKLENEKWAALKAAVKEGRITTYSCNGLIDPSLRLTGPDVDFDAIRSYCDRLFDRFAELGVTMLTFGSGKAKHVPDGFSMEKAWEQLFEIGYILASKAKTYGQTIVVEPLSYNEVNIVNTVEDASYYARTVNRDNFKVLVDFYHFDNNEEPFSSLEKNRDLIVHTHFAAPKTRMAPKSEEDWRFFETCIGQLRQIGYTGQMSFEGRTSEIDELNAMLTKMKEIEASFGV